MHHDVILFLLALAVLLGSSRILGEVSRRFGFPAVVGEIVSGILIGKTVLGRFAPSAFAWLFPEGTPRTLLSGYTTVAVMLLLVVAGLEIDLTVVRKSGPVVIATSLLGIIVPFILGYGVGLVLPDQDLLDPTRRGLHAAFLGIALSISALPVIAKTLLDLGLMKTDLGIIILSSAVLDDLIGWTSFSILTRQFSARTAATPFQIVASVLLTLGFVTVVLLVVRPVVDRVLTRIGSSDDAASGRVLSLIMVLALFGGAATEALGMHAVFGAFVMGIAVGDSSRLREHTRQTLAAFVTYVFTPVFFASMALRLDFIGAFDLRLIAIILVIACVAKVVGCAIGARLTGVALRASVAIGFGMNSRGAMEILLATLAREAGIINDQVFVALVIMAVVTSMISGPALVRLLRPSSSRIAGLLGQGAVEVGLSSRTREELIGKLATSLAGRLGRPADAERIAAKVLEREALAGTGVGDGVAFPHAEVDGLHEPALAFGRLEHGLDFDAPDGAEVHLVFMLLTPPTNFHCELQILSSMARLLTREEVRRALLAAPDAAAVIATLNKGEGPEGAKDSPPRSSKQAG